jgi:uncharacterized protein YciI
MPYVIETWDKPDSRDLRDKIRPSHVVYLDQQKSKLLGAGAKLSDDGETMTGSIYIVDTEDREEAERFLAGDPFMVGGVFVKVAITRWRKAFFDFKNLVPHLMPG